MDESAVSTVDMILERHRSSLLPAASSARAVERTSTAASGAASAPGFEESFTSRAPPQRQQEQQQPPPLPPPPPQQTPAVVSLPSAAAAPPATASTEGSPFPQRGKAVVGVGAGVGVPHLPCGRSPPSSTRQTRPHESQPEIVRHEVADLCDTLQFRLRANDRDLESILSRSADRLERLSLSEQGSPAAATSARMAPTGTPPVQQENPTSTAEMISEQASNPVRAASGSSPALPSTDPPAEARRPPVGSDANEGPDRSASAVVSSRKDTPTEARSPLPASDSGAQQTSGVSSPSSFSSPAPEMAEIPTATAQQAARANPGGVSSKQSKLSGTVRGEGGGGDSNAKGGVLDASVSTPQRSTGSDPRYTGAGPGGVDGGYQQRAPGGGRSIHGGGVGRGRDSGGVLNQGTAMGSNSTGAGMPTIATPPQLPRSLADGMIVEAAREAARWLAVDDRTWHQSKKFLDDCMADCPNEKTLNRRGITKDKWWENKVASIKAAILADPSLATCRSVNRSALPMDGWTPLHLAAARGNLRFVEALLESSSVGAFSVDLQGRTALALAAEGGHEDVVKLLKSRMESESADTIVGINAPVDLAGRTPLAWSVRSRARNKQVEPHLYAAGDASVCPTTPAALRSGGGRAAGAGTGAGRASVERGGGGLPCGYADVPGWRIEMEDAVCRHNPIAVVSREPRGSPPPESVSMFGVFDGHGGAFTSKYVSEKLVTCLRSTSGWKLGKRDPQVLCTAIREAFVSCDLQLAREPRMLVTETQNPQSGKRFEARDASGSTAVVALVTPAHAIIANAGDSRAILITVSGAVPGVSSASSNMKSSRIGVSSDVVGGGGGRGNGHGRTPPRVQQPGTDGLGPSWTPPQDSSIGGSDVGDGRDGDFESPVGDSSALNDSVRLEEDDGDEGDGSGEGQDGAGAGDEEGKDGAGRMPHAVTLGDGDEWMGEADDALGALAGTSNGGRQESEDLRCLGKKRVHVRPLSRDHTAANNWEKERVEAAGGRTFVVDYTDDNGESSSVVRTAYDTVVEGQSVMPTRGFGDFYYKQKKGGDGNLLPSEKQVVSACPEVVVHERGSSGDEELLLLACDGVWDVFENQDAGEFFISQLERPVGKVTGEDLALACDALVQACLQRGSTDNITALAVSLGSGPPPPPSAVGGRVLFAGDGL